MKKKVGEEEMNGMDLNKAWEIVGKYCGLRNFSEEQAFLYEEALNYIFQMSDELSRSSDMWEDDVIIGAYNLAAYYERIGKLDLAVKYYRISMEHGCETAGEKIEKIIGWKK